MRGKGKRIAAFVLVAVLVIPVLGDWVMWTRWRQQLQGKADTAAMAGIRAIRRGHSPEAAARSELEGFDLAAPPRIEAPPRSGAYAGKADAVRVSLEARRSPFFHSRLFGASRMHAQATAARVHYRGGGHSLLRVE